MNTVSILLQEARPLYVKRKTRIKTLKKASFIAVLMCFMVGQPMYQQYQNRQCAHELYMSLYDDASFESAFYLPNATYYESVIL